MVHLDLFSGIGGFAYAVDQVWDNVTHIFCDNDKFCQQVLKKHWPESEIYDDIRDITDTPSERWSGQGNKTARQPRQPSRSWEDKTPFLLTGGFPCQPFSAAGLRRGTADERHLWPEMLRVIRLTQPTWVIAENVRGLLTWNNGVVFEQVCTDLEASGYEVQPFIIPALAVNAPHRRDRIWFVAHSTQLNDRGNTRELPQADEQQTEERQEERPTKSSRTNKPSPLSDTEHDGRNGTKDPESNKKRNGSDAERPEQVRQPQRTDTLRFDPKEWERDWLEVATWSSRVDDGLPDRSHRLKALGNAIVPQVAVELMRGILVKNKPGGSSEY